MMKPICIIAFMIIVAVGNDNGIDDASAIESLRERALTLQRNCYYGTSWVAQTLGPLFKPPLPALDLEPKWEETRTEEYLKMIPIIGGIRDRILARRTIVHIEGVVTELEQCPPAQMPVVLEALYLIDDFTKYVSEYLHKMDPI